MSTPSDETGPNSPVIFQAAMLAQLMYRAARHTGSTVPEAIALADQALEGYRFRANDRMLLVINKAIDDAIERMIKAKDEVEDLKRLAKTYRPT